MSKPSESLLVLNTGFTVEVDGPGQRMVIYLKGCNMCCPWCAAPESMNPSPEVLFYPGRVEDAARLPAACPRGAVEVVDGNGSRETTICRNCDTLDCAPSDNPAFEKAGEEIPVTSLVEKIIRYRSFYSKLGGVTIGGGEPTCQFAGLRSLLTKLHSRNIHTAIETNGTSEQLSQLYPVLDLLYIDLKHPDDDQAAGLTGQGNRVILDNIRHRHAQGGRMIVRICLVPGYNADDDTLRSFGKTLSAIGSLNVEILPFHRRGEVKWRALGRKMPAVDAIEPTPEHINHAHEILSEYGLRVR